jgi:rubredoxin
VEIQVSLSGYPVFNRISDEHREAVMREKDTPYICAACSYIYCPARGEPKNGIPPQSSFEDLPATYTCPLCGKGKTEKNAFHPMEAHSGKYRCITCGYIYNPRRGEPKNGIQPDTAFRDLPESYLCPICGSTQKSGGTHFCRADNFFPLFALPVK